MGGVPGQERRLSEVSSEGLILRGEYINTTSMGGGIIYTIQVVDGLREELSQARVSNNQLLEALEVIYLLIFTVIFLILTAAIMIIIMESKCCR